MEIQNYYFLLYIYIKKETIILILTNIFQKLRFYIFKNIIINFVFKRNHHSF